MLGANAAINPWFLVGEGVNIRRGYNITDALAYKLALRLSGTYPSPHDRSNLEAWNPIGRTSVG